MPASEGDVKIFVLNAGSSTIKASLYGKSVFTQSEAEDPLWHGVFDWGKEDSATLKVTAANGEVVEQKCEQKNPANGIKLLLDTATQGPTKVLSSFSEIAIIGHRVVHGGNLFQKPVLITPEVEKAITELFPLAPLHNPYNLEGINIMGQLLPSVPQVAVFDTSFHQSLREDAYLYPGPYAWKEKNIRRYGFHGISHQYCTERCKKILPNEKTDKIVSCHLGNGASLAAIHEGKSRDTTMGFTPLEGLMMGSRSGSIDPSIVFFLQKEQHISPDKLVHMLNYESGLKGISGFSEDMRSILKAISEGNVKAKLAYDMYVHSLKRNLGAMIGVLEGIDVLIFTAGIGENSPEIRESVCKAFSFLGIDLNDQKNQSLPKDEVISSSTSKVHVLVISTKEEWMIARECNKFYASL